VKTLLLKTLPVAALLALALSCAPHADKEPPKLTQQYHPEGRPQKDPAEEVYSALFSPDNRLVLVTYRPYDVGPHRAPREPRGLALFEVQSGKCLWTAKGLQFGAGRKDWEPRAVAFFPDSKSALVQTFSRLQVWDVQAGRLVREFPRDPEVRITASAMSPDGRLAMVGGDYNALTLYDVASGKAIRSFPFDSLQIEPGAATRIESILFSPDGKLALANHFQQTIAVTLWEVDTGKLLRSFPTADSWNGYNMAFAPDSKTAVMGRVDRKLNKGNLVLVEVPSGKVLREFHEGGGRPLAFTPDGKQLLGMRYPEENIEVFEVGTGQRVRTFRFNKDLKNLNRIILSGDGSFVLTATGTDTLNQRITLTIWDVTTGEVVRTLEQAKEGPQ
jgi:WD40 repeat protein